MTKNERLYGIIGTIGNGSELRPAKLREEVVVSYHVILPGVPDKEEERAIRYTREAAKSALTTACGSRYLGVIVPKPIFRQFPPEIRN